MLAPAPRSHLGNRVWPHSRSALRYHQGQALASCRLPQTGEAESLERKVRAEDVQTTVRGRGATRRRGVHRASRIGQPISCMSLARTVVEGHCSTTSGLSNSSTAASGDLRRAPVAKVGSRADQSGDRHACVGMDRGICRRSDRRVLGHRSLEAARTRAPRVCREPHTGSGPGELHQGEVAVSEGGYGRTDHVTVIANSASQQEGKDGRSAGYDRPWSSLH